MAKIYGERQVAQPEGRMIVKSAAEMIRNGSFDRAKQYLARYITLSDKKLTDLILADMYGAAQKLAVQNG